MKKLLLIIILLLVVGVTGCTEIKDDKPVMNQDGINEVILLIEILPTEISKDDETLINQIRDSYDALTAEEQALVTNYNILVNAENAIAAIYAAEEAKKLEEEKKNQEILNKLKATAEEIFGNIPSILTDNLTLPARHTADYGVVGVSWSSSDTFVLTSIGQLIPAYVQKQVTLSAIFSFETVRYTHSKIVTINPIEFDPLPAGRTVFAYTYGLAHGFDEVAKNTIDVINHAFATVVDGKLNVGGLSDKAGLLSLRKDGMRVVLCIGGYANEAIPWSKAASTEEGRIQLAASIVENVVKYNYDGVDVDWEYPGFYTDPSWPIRNPIDSQNYTLMMAEIKRQLKAVNPDYIFSAAVPGGTWGPERYEISKLTPIFDFFHLMTYDLDATDKSTHLTALHSSTGNTINKDCSVEGTVNIYLTRGGAGIRGKLVVGAAFYGRKFTKTTGMGTAAGKEPGDRTSISFSDIKKLYIDKGYTESWDAIAKAPYIYDAENRVVISYDNPKSLLAKSQYILDNQLGGMMFWQYGQDNTGTLVNAINQGLKSNN